MKKIINNIRQKPEKTRGNIALFAAIIVTGLVVVVWVISLPNRFRAATEVLEEGDVQPKQPFGVLIDSLKETVKTTKEQQSENPFQYDENTSFSENTETESMIETSSEETMQPQVYTIDTTIETDESKDQTEQ